MLDSQVPKRKPKLVHELVSGLQLRALSVLGPPYPRPRRVRLSLLVGSVALVRYVAGQLTTNITRHSKLYVFFKYLDMYLLLNACVCRFSQINLHWMWFFSSFFSGMCPETSLTTSSS